MVHLLSELFSAPTSCHWRSAFT